nr:unnamed protein product [Digitaria exilis]
MRRRAARLGRRRCSLLASVTQPPTEDEIIVQMVNKYGPKKWSTIAQALPGRIGKQCRERTQELTDAEEPMASTAKEQLPKDIETVPDEKKGDGALFYEPPRFPDKKLEFSDGNKENFYGAPEEARDSQNAGNKQPVDEQGGQQCSSQSVVNPNTELANNSQAAGILVEHNCIDLIAADRGAKPESLSLCKEAVSSKPKPAELVVEKSSPCINADYEYVNLCQKRIGISFGMEISLGFVSPAERTYDALGLVKQISKHSAAAAVEACEVLGSGSRTSDKENKENTDDKEPETRKSKTKILLQSPLSSPNLNLTWYTL